MTTIALKRVGTYVRVSSEDQRERETIKTQSEALENRLDNDPSIELVARCVDDGISGTIPMGERPDGRRLLMDAAARKFDEVWVYNVKRLGRETIDLLVISQQLEKLGIRLVSLTEGEQTGLGYGIQAIVSDYDRKQFLRLSADGMNRAAREGRYTGGIVPMGYQVEGRKQTARLGLSEKIIWGDWTEADLVRQIYHWLAFDGWSCPRISRHLNALGVPTAYTKDLWLVRRGQRKERTQGQWRPGRIRNMVVNPVYRGILQYGRRSTRPAGREIIASQVPPLVSDEVWEAAQGTLARNRLMPKNSPRVYLLRSVIRCGDCGKSYVGCWGKDLVWYRCNGRMIDRRPVGERCQAKGLRGPNLEEVVWGDVERFLRDPGDILEELSREREGNSNAAAVEAEQLSLENALRDLQQRRKKAIDMNLRGTIYDEHLDDILKEIALEQQGIEKSLRTLEVNLLQPIEPLGPDLLEDLKKRLADGLTDLQRQEVVRLLVKRITVHTEFLPEGKQAKVLIEYRFPSVVNDDTGSGSAAHRSPPVVQSWRRR